MLNSQGRGEGVALRTQLILFMGILVLLATASLGSIAYRTSRTIIEQDAVRDVGVTATVRKQVLIGVLAQQRDRAGRAAANRRYRLSHRETWCLKNCCWVLLRRRELPAARLAYRDRAAVMVGKDAASLPAAGPSEAGQIAHFSFDRRGRPSYVLQVLSRSGNGVLTIRGDMQLPNQIFLDRYGLGQSGETFLTDSRGFFLTPPKYPAPKAKPARSAASRSGRVSTEWMARAWAKVTADATVIYGFRSVPEIGGGCIMALIDQTEAFAPTKRVAKDVAGVSGILAMMAIVVLAAIGATGVASFEAAHRPRAILAERRLRYPGAGGRTFRSAHVCPDFPGHGAFT